MNDLLTLLCAALPPVACLVGIYLLCTFEVKGWHVLVIVLAWATTLAGSITLLSTVTHSMTVTDSHYLWGGVVFFWCIGIPSAGVFGGFAAENTKSFGKHKVSTGDGV